MTTLPNKWYNYFFFSGGVFKLIVITICLIFSAWLGYQGPRLLMELGRAYLERELFYPTLLKLGCLYIGFCLNRMAYQWLTMSYVLRLIEQVRAVCYNSWLLNHDLQTETFSTDDRYPMGEVLARIMGDTDAFRELVTSGTLTIFIDIFFVMSCFVGFLSLNTFIGGGILVAECIACLLLFWAGKRMRKAFMQVRNARGNLARVVVNIVGGIRETYYTHKARYARVKGRVAFENFLNKTTIANIWDASYYSVAEGIYPILIVLVVLMFPQSGIAEVAIMFALIDLIQRSIEPIKGIASKITNIQRAQTGLERVFNFLNDLKHPEKWVKQGQSLEVDEIRVDIEEFAYQKDGFKLENISFTALKGQLVGIVGTSGSGKTTLVNIMAGNIIPRKFKIELVSYGNDPSISFSGHSSSLGSSIYRQQVGLISQESHIFTESVLFNISFEHRLSKEFEDFWGWVVDKIPYLKHWGIGPMTRLTPASLSGGQKQLLTSIRSCYLKRPVVLFDEISSGLDSALEEALREVILLVQKNSITFLIAHRPETILKADQILLMDSGKLFLGGSQQDMMKRSSQFREFFLELSG